MSVTARGPAREAWRREQLSKAHSASPRPQRFRAVDAVKLAKQELETTGPILKAGRLRLASVLDDGSGRDPGPVLHDGFYKLAATVTRPEPSLRQKAINLQKSLETQLESLRVAAGKDVQSLLEPLDLDVNTALPAIEGEKRSDTFITQEEPSVEASFGLQLVSAAPCETVSTGRVGRAISRAQLARQELELCVDILQSYARETSSDCRERRAFLSSTASTAAVSIQKFSEVVQRQSEEALDAERRIGELQAKITELEEDTEGLRRVVQQMLKDEAELRKQNEETVAEVNERQQQLTEAEHRSDHLSVQLHKAMEKIHLQEELQRDAREKLRDGANSPMMHFTTFVLGPDQVPSGSGVNISSGEMINRMERTRTDKSQAGMSASGHSTRNSMVSAGHMPPDLAASQSLNSQVLSRSVTPDMMAESSSDEDRNLPMVKKSSSRRQMTQESSDSEASAEPPRPSPLAVSFPALVPYLDFQKDAESNKIKAQTAAQNQDHLEKHMMMLQEERQKHIEQNKLLQQAVDSTLERLLVWVQAAFDSLRDFGPQSVQQDATALATIRDMLAWLAERTCKAWIEASANLPQVLYSHEERVRQALELAEKDSSLSGDSRNEVEELRKALQEQTERVEELERQVQAAATEHRASRASPGQGISALQAGSLEQDLAEVAEELGGRSLSLDPSDPRKCRDVPATEMELPAEVGPEALEEVKETEDQQPEECDAGRAAALEAEQEAQRMRLFRCPFAEGVDLTYVKRDRQFPYSMEDPEENKRLGRRQLRHWISEVYAAKRLEDRRRDKAKAPRRQMHFIMQEMLRRQHGVKSLVHQRSWQLLEAVAEHASDVAVGLFADFLDGSRDLDELSFYLYCSHLIATVPEEAQALPPSRLPMGYVSESRCLRLVELLFSDLPKAKTVVQEEIEKQVPLPGWAVPAVPLGTPMTSLEDLSYMSFDESLANTRCIEADALCRALLEGWRVCCLLLSKSMPHFSWRDTILAFIQADVHSRGWLDPHEVQKAECHPALARKSRSQDSAALTDHTSLGAFVFRIVQHLGGLTEASLKEDVLAETALEFPGQKEQQICFQLCLAAFRSLERSLGVYLKWLLHSEEPRDRSVYRSVTGRIFAVRRAIGLGRAWPLMHNLRSLLVLLLSHQFDLQLTREEAQPEHVGWELTALLHVLRESWRRGASGVGPDFGAELEEVGENEHDAVVPELAESPQSPQSPLTGRERPALGPSVSFTVGQKLACD